MCYIDQECIKGTEQGGEQAWPCSVVTGRSIKRLTCFQEDGVFMSLSASPQLLRSEVPVAQVGTQLASFPVDRANLQQLPVRSSACRTEHMSTDFRGQFTAH